jgi:hypothetical protein
MDSKSVSKIVWLGVFVGHGSPEIEDPYGRSEETMAKVLQQLWKGSRNLSERLGLLRGSGGIS